MAASYAINKVDHAKVLGGSFDEKFDDLSGESKNLTSWLKIKEIFASSNGFITEFCERLQEKQREYLTTGDGRHIHLRAVENAKSAWQALLPVFKIECRDISIDGKTVRVIVIL
ncbi:MAG: hypothetical protein HZB76_00700 [Chlamydiae bacterium]|nr:hypothetical protein [Chlamydiota bacterium]